jgi:hypothetical protein
MLVIINTWDAESGGLYFKALSSNSSSTKKKKKKGREEENSKWVLGSGLS